MTDAPLHDGDLAYVRRKGRLDESALARYHIYDSVGHDENPDWGAHWQYFGSEWTDYPSEIEVVLRVTVVGPGAVDEVPALHLRPAECPHCHANSEYCDVCGMSLT